MENQNSIKIWPTTCNAHLEMYICEEEFEDTKGLIRIRTSKKNRKHNGQKKSSKGQTTIYKTYI